MYWYYSVKENGTKESKKICRLMQTDSRIYEFNDDLLSINPIEYMGRLTGESEYIFYRDIERLVDMNNEGLWRGETWKYRIPMRDIEELVVETEESSERPSPTTWWRIKGAFSTTRYENLTDFLMGNGTDNEKIVNEILLKRPFVGQREYEWQDRLAEKSGLKWQEP